MSASLGKFIEISVRIDEWIIYSFLFICLFIFDGRKSDPWAEKTWLYKSLCYASWLKPGFFLTLASGRFDPASGNPLDGVKPNI